MSAIDFGPKVKREIKNIKGSESLSERDKELLLDYKRDMKIDGITDGRIHKVLVHTRVLGEHLQGVGLENATKEDLKDLVEWVEDRDLAPSTKRDYRGLLKRFYKWLNGGEYPEKVKWISTTEKKRNKKLPEKLLRENDIEKLMGKARNPRDQALISLLWETGARIGELMGLKVGSFEDREHGQKIVIKGKTGARRLPLISSVPYINSWLSVHPKKDDPEAPLWCKLNGPGKVSYQRVRKILKEIGKRAGISKPMNPHHFRHSRATYLASRLTEAQMCEFFGWVQGSDRPADYVHLSGRDLDLQYDQMHGFEKRQGTEKSEVSAEQCPRCDTLNQPEAKFCQKCGLALDEKTAMEAEKKKAIGEMVMDKVEELSEEGTLDELIESAVEEKVRETLSKKSAD